MVSELSGRGKMGWPGAYSPSTASSTRVFNRMAEAPAVAYPRSTLLTCIVHLLRNSLSYAGYKVSVVPTPS